MVEVVVIEEEAIEKVPEKCKEEYEIEKHHEEEEENMLEEIERRHPEVKSQFLRAGRPSAVLNSHWRLLPRQTRETLSCGEGNRAPSQDRKPNKQNVSSKDPTSYQTLGPESN